MVCFLLPKCVFFLPMAFIRTFITTLCFYDFSKAVLVKKCTVAKVWFDFPLTNAYCLHWLLSSTLLTQLKHPEASEQAAKKVEGAALKLPPGLTRPDPANPSSEKMTSQPTCFCCAYFPKSVTNLHRLFNMSCINTPFDMFFKN